jgi:hypothetical protein
MNPACSWTVQKKQSPEGSRLRGFFRLHLLMSGERFGETTSAALVFHCCERGGCVRLATP